MTYIPGTGFLLNRLGTGGTNSARYCYSVFLRHLIMTNQQGMKKMPKTVVELGPGDSLGIGLSALLSGVDKYYALDAVKFANIEKNLKIFEELVELFKNRENIPKNDEFPLVVPRLDSYDFPDDILSVEYMNEQLSEERINKIRNSLLNSNKNDSNNMLRYIAPWNDKNIIEQESIDWIYSQAVLEHIDNLESAYQSLYYWLKPGGFMSHSIDFRCHNTAVCWNGHWKRSDLIWKLFKGKSSLLINREPVSSHLNIMKKNGFNVINNLVYNDEKPGIKRSELAKRFKDMSDEDLNTPAVFIQTVKPE